MTVDNEEFEKSNNQLGPKRGAIPTSKEEIAKAKKFIPEFEKEASDEGINLKKINLKKRNKTDK